MALRKPKSAKEVRYFTRKTIGSGKVMIWVFNPRCPKCGKQSLRIPYDEEKGRFKSRSRNFVCYLCGHEVPKKKIKEKTPTANISYVCPYCSNKGELQKPFNRTKSTKLFKFECQKCGKTVRVGKMKGKKK